LLARINIIFTLHYDSIIVYSFLFSAQRTVLRRIAGIYRARNAMLSPPSPPPIGSGDIVGDECIHSELSDSLPFGSSWVVVVLVSGSGVLHCGLVILFTSLHSCNLTIRFSG